MEKRITLRKAGGSVTATIPKEIADQLKFEAGQQVSVRVTDEGMLVTAYDPIFARAMAVAERAMKDYNNALRELAK